MYKTKVAIIGLTGTRVDAPFDDERWEFWGLNNLYQHLNGVKWNKWFELHKFFLSPSGKMLRNGYEMFRGKVVQWYLDDLKQLPCPVYMREDCQIIENSIIYPKDLIINQFGKYMSSTPSWMLALAINLGFTTIGIFGIDMATSYEYSYQRASFEYLLGYAKGAGIDIIMPNSCPLLRAPLYGLGDN